MGAVCDSLILNQAVISIQGVEVGPEQAVTTRFRQEMGRGWGRRRSTA